MEFVKGQRVHVEFDGVVCEPDGGTDPENWIGVRNNDGMGLGYIHHFWRSSEDGEITPLVPVSWPPRVGDIWEADGNEYFVRPHSSLRRDDTVVESLSRSPQRFYYTSGLDDFKALNPRLIRRREV